MKKKKFKVRVKAETVSTKYADIDVLSTGAHKACGAAEERSENLPTEWIDDGMETTVISSEIIE